MSLFLSVKTTIFYLFLTWLLLTSCKRKTENQIPSIGLQNGDLIFQTTLSGQSKAIQLATHSKYSHVGILYEIEKGRWEVFEAVQPVKLTPFADFIARGKDGHFVVKRLKNAEKVLTTKALLKMKQEGRAMLGKKYDLAFGWGDDRLYCSELVWKIYQRGASIELGKPQRLGDFDLKQPEVAQKLAKRYGKNIPLDEPMISPAAIFESDALETANLND